MKDRTEPVLDRYPTRVIPKNVVKLSVLSLLFFAIYASPALVAASLVRQDRKRKRTGIFFISSLPFLSVLFYLFRHSKFGKPDLGKLANIRFHKDFPLLLLYDPKGNMSAFKDEHKEAKMSLQKGDIILRRNEYYLDSLVLNQTSFFTHAGVCAGVEKGEPKIVHAIGAGGVSKAGWFKDFIRSEDVAVLRLKESELENFDNHLTSCSLFLAAENVRAAKIEKVLFELNQEEKGKIKKKIEPRRHPLFRGVLSDDHLRKVDVRLAIEGEKELVRELQPPIPGSIQLRVYDSLTCKERVSVDECVDVFAEMYQIYKGRHYDYFFDFSDDNTMSCVEFVWYCFKCAFPVHKVKEAQIKWFKQFGPLAVNTLVILPDDFVRSDAFEVVYTSVKKDGKMVDKTGLVNHIEANKLNPLKFIFKLVALQTVMIASFLVSYHLASKPGLAKR
jgi:hypothetical protein